MWSSFALFMDPTILRVYDRDQVRETKSRNCTTGVAKVGQSDFDDVYDGSSGRGV